MVTAAPTYPEWHPKRAYEIAALRAQQDAAEPHETEPATTDAPDDPADGAEC